MAKAKRVFEIARELNVASKAVVEKCQAEGVPGITNHMSTVSVGLAQSIRDWFSEGEEEASHTAVEEAEKVDLSAARKARRKRARKAAAAAAAGDGDSGDDSGDTAVAVEEPPRPAARRRPRGEDDAEDADALRERVSRIAKAKAKPKKAEPDDEAPAETQRHERVERQERRTPRVATPATTAETETETETDTETQAAETGTPAAPAKVAAEAAGVQEQAPPAETATTTEAGAGAETAEPKRFTGPVGKPNVPDRPDVVAPAGKQLDKPAEVKMKGPNVVRVEKPDVIEPRRRPRQGGGGFDNSSLADGVVPGIARSRGPARGKGAGGGGAPEAPPRKRRSLSNRRGRSADAATIGQKKLSPADYAEQQRRLDRSAGLIKRRRWNQSKRGDATTAAVPIQTGGKVEIREPITIKSLSAATGIKASDIVKYLFAKGIPATINSAIGTEAAMEVSLEYDIELEVKEQETAEQALLKEFEDRDPVDVRPRPPVVTVLGHVDHGKTSLLDRIRKADVASHEAGGITQHVGAYRITVTGNDGEEKTVVFLDTPGHEAFTSMRARGADLTDLVVLVVAADDGVMPQTIESINHAKAAEVPIIVALNKIDKREATEENIRKIYGQLAERGLNPTEWGGDTEILKVSATEGTGVTDMMEVLDYQAELLDLKADYGGPARGVVIEAEMQEGRGPVARVLVQDGRMKVGDFIVAGRAFGRVRDMTDDKGRRVQEVGPATPLEVSGIDVLADAGNHFYITNTLQKAEDIAMHHRDVERQRQLADNAKVTLKRFAQDVSDGSSTETKELRVVLKGDVHGSVETIRKSLGEVGNDEVRVRVLHAAVGGVNESDVDLADASNAIIIGFNVGIPAAVRDIAEEHHVEVRLYRIIYELLDEVKQALEGMLEPDYKEETLGEAEVKQVFRIGKLGAVAGCIVNEGVVRANAKMRVERQGVVVTERPIESLRRVKDEVKEVQAGTECGIRLKNFEDLKADDRLICFKTIEVKRKLD